MKKTLFFFASAVLALTLAACNGQNTVNDDDYATGEFQTLNDDDLSNNEKIFKRALVAYIDNTVLPTYEGMSDNAIKLATTVNKILEYAIAGDKDNTDLVKQAGEQWTASRKYWEQSEAFLYGPAADYSIDPHIDSWPFDQAAFEDIISNEKAMNELREKLLNNTFYVTDGSEFDEYGLMGYHALEYVLFALSEDGQTSSAHKIGDFSVAQWTFMAAVANDLRNQSILLEGSWRGYGRLSSEKQNYLKTVGYTGNKYPYLYNGYAQYMLQPGVGDKVYATYQEAVEELIAGAIDIADEVGNSKIGAAANAIVGSETYDEDHDNIESPYSLHSIIDFQDNIRSIQNAMFGSKKNDANVTDDFIQQKNAALATELANLSDAAIATIGLIQEPFVDHAKDNQAQLAIAAVEELQDALKSAWQVVSGTQWVDEEEE